MCPNARLRTADLPLVDADGHEESITTTGEGSSTKSGGRRFILVFCAWWFQLGSGSRKYFTNLYTHVPEQYWSLVVKLNLAPFVLWTVWQKTNLCLTPLRYLSVNHPLYSFSLSSIITPYKPLEVLSTQCGSTECTYQLPRRYRRQHGQLFKFLRSTISNPVWLGVQLLRFMVLSIVIHGYAQKTTLLFIFLPYLLSREDAMNVIPILIS